ncbi:MAG: hypothetical protein ABSG72_01655 [Candidatus Sulfotelmatobacter sp.]
MAIDNPKEAFEQQYMREEEKTPLEMTVFTSKLAFPKAALPLEIFRRVADRFTKVSVEERLQAMWNFLVMETEHLESTKVSVEDAAQAAQMVMRRDAEEFNDAKRKRYLKVFGNALRSGDRIDDIVSYIESIQQMTERDFIVLQVVNKVMNKQGDWKAQHDPVMGQLAKLHPSTLISRRKELSDQIAIALGQATDRNNAYNREEGYAICCRLEGFGLVHEIEQTREPPLADYIFRLSVQGVVLLKLLGENAPNYEHYIRR